MFVSLIGIFGILCRIPFVVVVVTVILLLLFVLLLYLTLLLLLLLDGREMLFTPRFDFIHSRFHCVLVTLRYVTLCCVVFFALAHKVQVHLQTPQTITLTHKMLTYRNNRAR